MKRTIGLDLGTTSIGWAVVEEEDGAQRISMAGSRIIPADTSQLNDFNNGNSVSETADRTLKRGMRRLRERMLLRRSRLHQVLHIMGFLPEHYDSKINFINPTGIGNFLPGEEPKIAWVRQDDGKCRFLFEESFLEMVTEFAEKHPTLLADGKKIPHDWTLYYLRKKALEHAITKEELAWVLLSFNQKRGYKFVRGEDEQEGKRKEYHALKVVKVVPSDKKKGSAVWYDIHLENGWVYSRSSKEPLDWEGKVIELISTTELESDGTEALDKEGNVKRSLSAPSNDDDWTLKATRTEAEIKKSGKTVGQYIYDAILEDPCTKIIGGHLTAIERKFYHHELHAILQKQCEFHPDLTDNNLLEQCAKALYKQNEIHRDIVIKAGFVKFLADDILLYQRPLKSKKHLIANCPYESHIYKVNGEEKVAGIKCVPASHPLYQEYRVWQFIANLKIIEKEKRVEGKLFFDVDVTKNFLKNEDDYVRLFENLMSRMSITQEQLLKSAPFNIDKKECDKYRWNYVQDKTYPMAETRAQILNKLKKIKQDSFLTPEREQEIWHILYSTEDKEESTKALRKYAEKNNLPEAFVDVMNNTKPYKKDYGAYSLKAIKKLLALMRMGKYWSEDNIDKQTRQRIEKIMTGEYDEDISDRVRDKAKDLTDITKFKGLPQWLACYITYGRHSEAKDVTKWDAPCDIDRYLAEFRLHSLNNPLVEKIVLETLRVVRDIWEQVGTIDEIHVELARELKNNSEQRSKISRENSTNEKANLRARLLLTELLNPQCELNVDGVIPGSIRQIEKLRLYEEGALNAGFSSAGTSRSENAEMEKIFNTLNEAKDKPTPHQVSKYLRWVEQNYRSPYTGQPISISRLFTADYEIEHVIPQARYYDDSKNNKVICEAAVNKLKSDMLGYEFIKKHSGEEVDLGQGKKVRILTPEAYERNITSMFGHNQRKKEILMLEDIPEKMTSRQLNDTRYISRLITTLLSNIVRAKDENGQYEQEAVSRNVVACNGSVTTRLKQDWGLNDVWNDIVQERFQRLNNITGTNLYGHWSDKDKRVFLTSVPAQDAKNFSKKRIDHRHHAMDAIVVACTKRSHINFLNNAAANEGENVTFLDLRRKLCVKQLDDRGGYRWAIGKPWETFTQDSRTALQGIVASIKKTTRVINKSSNKTEHYVTENGKLAKKLQRQTKGDRWAIRQPMHKETYYGHVNLLRVRNVSLKAAIKTPASIVDRRLRNTVVQMVNNKMKPGQIEKAILENTSVWKDLDAKAIPVYYFTDDVDAQVAVRKSLIGMKYTDIESMTDTGIQKILKRYYEVYQKDVKSALSAGDLDKINENIVELNGGKQHMPIYKVRLCERLGLKYTAGNAGNKSTKYVETEKNTNLFFGIYVDSNGERKFASTPLNVAIERQKQYLSPVPETDENGNRLLFYLSPGDLVYVPTQEETESGSMNFNLDKKKIYKLVSCSRYQAFFVPVNVAHAITDTIELGTFNKSEKSWDNIMIKKICLPVKIDRLGNAQIIEF